MDAHARQRKKSQRRQRAAQQSAFFLKIEDRGAEGVEDTLFLYDTSVEDTLFFYSERIFLFCKKIKEIAKKRGIYQL